ncbi:hypothetical protein M569_03086 [Genlisea aurea]|uniref:Uncharacterized protein n=1 Tax=Genlisea aurea TaxID=192259 RepID=S8EG81_9LAMI|nr:hypothetical protein M569_03086 [Genlisea aurea]
MSQTELEAEQIRDLVAQNSERRVPDSLGCQLEGAPSSCLTLVATAVILTRHDGDDLAKSVNEEKIGFDNQIDSGIQANEQIQCPDHDLVRNRGINADDEELAATRGDLEGQIDSDGEPKISVGEVTEGIQCMDPMDASSDSKAEDKLNEDIVDKKVEETFKDTLLECVEPIKEQQTLNDKNGTRQVILPVIDKKEVNDAEGTQQVFISTHGNDGNGIPVETTAKNTRDPSVVDPSETLTPNSHTGNAEDRNGETMKSVFTPTSLSLVMNERYCEQNSIMKQLKEAQL